MQRDIDGKTMRRVKMSCCCDLRHLRLRRRVVHRDHSWIIGVFSRPFNAWIQCHVAFSLLFLLCWESFFGCVALFFRCFSVLLSPIFRVLVAFVGRMLERCVISRGVIVIVRFLLRDEPAMLVIVFQIIHLFCPFEGFLSFVVNWMNRRNY